MGADMYGRMDGAAAWMMALRWTWAHTVLLLAMWAVMMIGMMAPAAAPVLLLYAGVVRSSAHASHVRRRVWTLAAGYLTVWLAFSVVATMLQRLLTQTAILTPMMELQNGTVSGVLLLLVGLYQLSPFKGECLRLCRSPAHIVSGFWRPGTAGAFRMGLRHGAHCLGCCWALMLLLFVGGVMNLYAIAAITAAVLVEKLTPFGVQASRAIGVLMLAAGVWIVAG